MIRVWDRLVRVFHWSLAIGFFVAYIFSEDESLTLHVWVGYGLGVLIVARTIWGFVGTEHARFADFAYSPFAALRYFLNLLRGRAPRFLGHSPAGAVMVYLLLFFVASAVVTGLLHEAERGYGPLDGIVALAGSSRGEWLELHEMFANVGLLLVFAHIAGVVLASFVHRENLVRAMVTGRKRR